MAKIKPFKAFRPTRDKVHLLASRSYVSYSESQLRDKLENNPFSFIHIINPDYLEDRPSEPGSTERFEKVRERFNEFVQEGFLEQDQQACYYVYRQTKHDLDCIGVIAVIAAEDYDSGHIKIHEETLAQREELFAHYLDVTNFNAEPTLMCHVDVPDLNAFYQQVMEREPEYDYTTTDRVGHQFWCIADAEEIALITSTFSNVPSVYIADGHHRSASSALLARNRKTIRPKGERSSDYFMTYLIPASGLVIHGYHRLVRDLGQLSEEEFLRRIASAARLSKLDHKDKLPRVGTIDMYLHGSWYRVDFSEHIDIDTPDAAWLTKNILAPILGISDLRTDPRISFEPETTGLPAIAEMIDDERYACAFILHPVPFDQLKCISDQSKSMPPKSTWIEPKLRSGLTIYELTDNV